MEFSGSFSVGDLVAGAAVLLTVILAANALNQWRSDTSLRLLEEYAREDLRDARSEMRAWLREVGPSANWHELLAEAIESKQPGKDIALSRLNRFYHRLGVLLRHGAVLPRLVLPEVRLDVLVFAEPLYAWLDVTTRRRELLNASLPKHIYRDYWRGTRKLLRVCGARSPQ